MFLSTFLCFLRRVSSQSRHRWHEARSPPPGIPSPPVYTSTRWILGDFVNVFHRDFCRENCINWRRDCWSLHSGGARIQPRVRRPPNVSISSKTKAKPITDQTAMTWLSSSGRGVIWKLQWGARRQWKSAECWMTRRDCEGLISTESRFQ